MAQPFKKLKQSTYFYLTFYIKAIKYTEKLAMTYKKEV